MTKSMDELLTEELQDLYSAETQILEALPLMIDKASNPELKEGFQDHLAQTQNQVERLVAIGKELQIDIKQKFCKGMEGLLKEGEEMTKKDGDPDVIDAGIIGAAQRVEHYEIAGYGTAITHAKQLGHNNVAKLLADTLKEEKATDVKLSKLAESKINKDAAK